MSYELKDPEKCPKTGKHRQSEVCYLNGKKTTVDKGLAPLIQGLINLGIKTSSSCEAGCGNSCNRRHKRFTKIEKLKFRGKVKKEKVYYSIPTKLCQNSVWIVFDRAKDAEKFCTTVFDKNDPEVLQFYMHGGWYGGQKKYSWIWSTNFQDLNDQRHMDHRGYLVGKVKSSTPEWAFFCYLVFPRAHLKFVTERIMAKVEKLNK